MRMAMPPSTSPTMANVRRLGALRLNAPRPMAVRLSGKPHRGMMARHKDSTPTTVEAMARLSLVASPEAEAVAVKVACEGEDSKPMSLGVSPPTAVPPPASNSAKGSAAPSEPVGRGSCEGDCSKEVKSSCGMGIPPGDAGRPAVSNVKAWVFPLYNNCGPSRGHS